MQSEPPTSDALSQIQQLLAAADQEFRDQCQARLEKGEVQYGSTAFLSVDTLDEAMAEVIDLCNYGRFTYIKLYMLRQALARITAKHPATDAQGFVSMKEFMQGG